MLVRHCISCRFIVVIVSSFFKGCLLPRIKNGAPTSSTFLIPGRVHHQANISIKCKQGYYLEGPPTVTCNINSWGDLPVCLSKSHDFPLRSSVIHFSYLGCSGIQFCKHIQCTAGNSSVCEVCQQRNPLRQQLLLTRDKTKCKGEINTSYGYFHKAARAGLTTIIAIVNTCYGK